MSDKTATLTAVPLEHIAEFLASKFDNLFVITIDLGKRWLDIYRAIILSENY
jgi:hypothetical protein